MSLKDRISHLRTMRDLANAMAGDGVEDGYGRGLHDGLATAVHIIDGAEGEPKLLGGRARDDRLAEKTEPEQ